LRNRISMLEGQLQQIIAGPKDKGDAKNFKKE